MFPYIPWIFIPLPSQSAEMQQFTMTLSSLQHKCCLQPKFSFPLKEFSAWHFYVPHRPLGQNMSFKDYCFYLPSVDTKHMGMLTSFPSLNHDPLCERAVEPLCKHWSMSLSDYFNSSHWLRNRLRLDIEVSFLKALTVFILKTLSIINPICSG